jgi:hypothetical protein
MSDKRRAMSKSGDPRGKARALRIAGLPLLAHRLSLIAAGSLLFSGCANIEPWVKPYEREALADPIMSFDAHPVSTSYMHHVYEAREGARGALGGAGGGCGCN